MVNISGYVKLNEKETKEFETLVLKNKHLLKEVDSLGSSLLHIAIRQGNLDLAKFLIDNGIDVNMQDNNGDTALHYCAEHNQYEIAKYILEHGGKLAIADKYGNEPLWTAASNDKGKNVRAEIIKLFLDFGADKLHKNNVNKTPGDIAVRYKNLMELFDAQKTR